MNAHATEMARTHAANCWVDSEVHPDSSRIPFIATRVIPFSALLSKHRIRQENVKRIRVAPL